MLARSANLLLAAAENLARKPRAYLVAASGLALALGLWLCGVAISEGLKRQALAALDAGADLYVTWDTFGRATPVPSAKVEPLSSVTGVTRAVPRIVGRVAVGERTAIVLGLPLAELARGGVADLEGTLPRAPAELLVGAELARALELRPGMRVALEGQLVRLFTVAGVLRPSAAPWSSEALVCELGEAAELFGEREHVSDVCLDVRPGYTELAAEAIDRLDPRYRVQTRALATAAVLRGMTQREGVFSALFALALALAIPSFAVLSWLGAQPRRREIGLLKADGWSAADVLEMVAFENLLVSLFAAGAATLFALAWVRALNAPLVAPFFLPDLPLFPAVRVPARLFALPPVLGLIASLAVTMTGSISTSWRTASARPAEALR